MRGEEILLLVSPERLGRSSGGLGLQLVGGEKGGPKTESPNVCDRYPGIPERKHPSGSQKWPNKVGLLLTKARAEDGKIMVSQPNKRIR